MDATKHTLPRKEYSELAEDLLARFPKADRPTLLKNMVARYFFDMRHGTKQGERTACDFLNRLQIEAEKLES